MSQLTNRDHSGQRVVMSERFHEPIPWCQVLCFLLGYNVAIVGVLLKNISNSKLMNFLQSCKKNSNRKEKHF